MLLRHSRLSDAYATGYYLPASRYMNRKPRYGAAAANRDKDAARTATRHVAFSAMRAMLIARRAMREAPLMRYAAHAAASTVRCVATRGEGTRAQRAEAAAAPRPLIPTSRRWLSYFGFRLRFRCQLLSLAGIVIG